jgi:hypothetical protein
MVSSFSKQSKSIPLKEDGCVEFLFILQCLNLFRQKNITFNNYIFMYSKFIPIKKEKWFSPLLSLGPSLLN